MDWKNWNKYEIFIGGFLLIPIRLILMGIFMGGVQIIIIIL